MLRSLTAVSMLLAATLLPAAQPAPSPEVLKDLAPTGKLRAAINFGNAVLAQKGPSGEPKGITPISPRALAKRLNVPVEFVPYRGGGQGVRGRQGRARGTSASSPSSRCVPPMIDFTAPYVIIEGTYMVQKNSPLKEIADVDKPGIRIAVGLGSAYDLYLTRTVKNATVVRAAVGGGKAMIEMWVNDKLEAAAGVRQQLEAYAKDHPEVRIMSGAFQQIQQAMGMPKKDGQVRPAGSAYLKAFVEEMKASGFVADALKRSNQVAVVAPPAK